MRLINDVLDLERMESGQVELERRATTCAELIQQAVEVMRPMAQNAGVELVSNEGSCPTRLYVDPDRMLQVLTNLLSNAIKFSAPGSSVEVSAQERATELQLRVRDHGVGIPQDRLTSIFERFHQVDPAESRRKGGTGLGLAISKSIVEQHGGRIWAESAPGQGATFFVALPLAINQVHAAA
jgi:signal transduction histidine kinase